jgi:shikimate dehydrogenase
VLGGGRRSGHNTDSWGFAESFRSAMAGSAMDVIAQFGAGGAGAAVAYALLELGTEDLVVFDPDHGRMEALARRMAGRFGSRVRPGSDVRAEISRCSGIVNTTPIGMAKYPGTPFPASLLRSAHWVAEVIYFPEETDLLRRARALGCRTLAGAGMAIGQAVRSFELFTGMPADKAAMTRHFGAAA